MTSTTNTTIQDQIAELAEQGRRRIAELNRQADEEMERQIEENRREIATKWRPYLESIYEALPEWMHEYVNHPPDTPPTEWTRGHTHYTPAHLRLPGLPTIRVYSHSGDTYFDVPVPEVDYNYAIGQWYVRRGEARPQRHEIVNMDTDIAVAVALAQDTAETLAEVEEEVRRRNEKEIAEPVDA